MKSSEPVSLAISKLLAQSFITPTHSFVVALSGGLDSICLLHALTEQLPKECISAVYIDHQLQADSSLWASQNQSVCQQLRVAYKAVKVEVDTTQSSLEQEARRARYQALASYCTEKQLLLTAHHQDDQAETLLLQLFRGAGSKGLASMASFSEFGQGLLARPLLQVSRQALEAYAAKHQLKFIQDPTNSDNEIRRNFVRQEVLPLIETKWTGVKQVLANTAKVQADNQLLLEELAQLDLQSCAQEKDKTSTLLIKKLKQLSSQRQANLLRYWLSSFDILMPNQSVLLQTQSQLIEGREDSNPLIQLENYSLRRYQDSIYLVDDNDLEVFFEGTWQWNSSQNFVLNNRVRISAEKFAKDYPQLVDKDFTISLRKEGLRFKPQGRAHSMPLKKYLHQEGVPPWLRDQVLLVWDNEELVAVILPECD